MPIITDEAGIYWQNLCRHRWILLFVFSPPVTQLYGSKLRLIICGSDKQRLNPSIKYDLRNEFQISKHMFKYVTGACCPVILVQRFRYQRLVSFRDFFFILVFGNEHDPAEYLIDKHMYTCKCPENKFTFEQYYLCLYLQNGFCQLKM